MEVDEGLDAARLDLHDAPCHGGEQQHLHPEGRGAHRAACRKKLDVLLAQQVDLSGAIEELIRDIEAGRKYMKTYKQMKMYNDPALNPVLYGQKK